VDRTFNGGGKQAPDARKAGFVGYLTGCPAWLKEHENTRTRGLRQGGRDFSLLFLFFFVVLPSVEHKNMEYNHIGV